MVGQLTWEWDTDSASQNSSFSRLIWGTMSTSGPPSEQTKNVNKALHIGPALIDAAF